jgi:hypothetical protein
VAPDAPSPMRTRAGRALGRAVAELGRPVAGGLVPDTGVQPRSSGDAPSGVLGSVRRQDLRPPRALLTASLWSGVCQATYLPIPMSGSLSGGGSSTHSSGSLLLRE